MTRRLVWKTREAALAAADPELVARLSAAYLNTRQVDPCIELEAQEAAAVAHGDKLDEAKASAAVVPGQAEGLAALVARARTQAAQAVSRRQAIEGELSRGRAQLETEGHAVIGVGWMGAEPGRAGLVRALLAFTKPATTAADLALAAIAIGFESPPADSDAWKALKTAYTVALKRHSR